MNLEKTKIQTFDELLQIMRVKSEGSAAFEKLAMYIEEYYTEVIFLTAEETASRAKVSQGTVSKFSQALGFRGYNDFLRNLQRIVGETITAPQRLILTRTGKYDSNDLLAMEAQNIQSLQQIVQLKEYEQIVDHIVNAQEVVLMAARLSATLLPYFKYLLDKLRNHVVIAMPEMNEWSLLSLKDPEKTAILAIGFPRYPQILLDKMRELKELGFQVDAITDRKLSPVVKLSENAICVPLTVSSIFDMYGTPMALINLLVRDVSKRIPNLEKRMRQIEEYDEKYKIYYKIK